jgi:hypothetical protein
VETTIIAACDEELLGKVYSGRNGVQLDLQKYRSFYEGERVTEKQLAKLLIGARNVNLVGNKSIAAASTVLPLSQKNARTIGGVLHLQFYQL